MDREAESISWGVSPENGDALSMVTAGCGVCERLYAAQTFHGDHDTAWIIEERDDGSECWHRADSIDWIKWKPVAAGVEVEDDTEKEERGEMG